MRLPQLGLITVVLGLVTVPAYADLFSSVQLNASLDSNPYYDPGVPNVSVNGACSSSNSCELLLTATPITALARATEQAGYGSVSEHYESTFLQTNVQYDGSVHAVMSASFVDTISLLGGPDYHFVQFNFSGYAGAFEMPSPPLPNLLLGTTVIPVQMHFSGTSPLFQTVQTPLLLLPANQFDFGLSLAVDYQRGFTLPSQIFDLGITLENMRFFDEDQNPIRAVLYSSESGTAYPIDGGEPVPEPSTILLLGTVLGLLASANKTVAAFFRIR
jgi:hypothetical protein